MYESEWPSRKQRVNQQLLALTPAREIVRWVEVLFALAGQIEARSPAMQF